MRHVAAPLTTTALRDHYADLVSAEDFPRDSQLEDYRAGVGIDPQHDEADRAAGRRIVAPFYWRSRPDDLQDLYDDPLAFWRSWPDHVRLVRTYSGHHHGEGSTRASHGDPEDAHGMSARTSPPQVDGQPM